jgi:hypothetical protein
VAKIHNFAFKKTKYQALWSRELFENFPKNNHHISMKKMMKSSRFLEDLDKLLTFFY